MKERPILFSAPMVQAILNDRKTQTRRVIKPEPELKSYKVNGVEQAPQWIWKNRYVLDNTFTIAHIDCPYGQVGDRLWVREPWRASKLLDHCKPSEFTDWAKFYEATDQRKAGDGWGRYRHARFMPRWASRITLEITDVRVERLQDISGADAIAEGVCSQYEFQYLWDSINAKTFTSKHSGGTFKHTNGHSWDGNPWVWVIEFKRVEDE